MLNFLHIENVALIKQLDIDFSSGFTTMTGETGSGKSMIIDSINFVIGQRSRKDIIRNGESECYVYAVFSDINKKTANAINEYSIQPEDDNTLTISRRFSLDGKSVSKINNRTVSVSTVKAVASHLISINEQHDSYSLLNDEYHIDYLDNYTQLTDKNHADNLNKYKEAYNNYIKAKKELSVFLENANDSAKKLDFLKFQKKEIETAQIKIGEEEQLLSDKILIKNSELISNAVKGTLSLLSGGLKPGAYDKIVSATDNIEKIKDMISGGEEIYSKCVSLSNELQDLINTVSSIDTGIYDDPTSELDKIEARLDLISKIKNKYGETEKDVLDFLDDITKQISDIEQFDFALAEYESKVKEHLTELRNCSLIVSNSRNTAAKNLCDSINKEFKFLDMERVRFDIEFKENDTPTEKGYESIYFLIQTNPGEDFKNLSDVASGGELSRVMLALKKVLSSCDNVDCIIFDEIDTGVSGKTSSKIGISLKDLAKHQQVICITHSAQVSAIADSHYKIYKVEKDGRMFTCVEVLDSQARIDEVSRILGGVTITESVIKTARELIDQGKKYI